MHRNFKFLAFFNFYFFDVQASKRPTSSFPHPRLADTFFIDFYSFCITREYYRLYLTPYSPTYIPPFTLSGEYYSIFTTYIHYLIFTIDSPWLRIRSVDSVHELTCREPYYTCVGLLVDVHVTLWRMSMEPGVAVDAGY